VGDESWDKPRDKSKLSWYEARNAVHDAGERVSSRFDSETGPGLKTRRREHPATSAAQAGYSHEDFRPAYWYGWEAAQQYSGRSWVDIASDLERGWDQARKASRLSWNEAEPAVREAWDQAATLQDRSKSSLAVPLQQLHDPRTGLLDASRIAEYLELPLKQLSGALGRNYSTVHRTPTAPAIQETLGSIKRSLEILEQVLVDKATILAWWNSPHPDLGRKTPMQVLLEGRAQIIEDMLEAALEGIPS
jgi:Protein of unknown function (DUF2384)